MPRYCSSRDRDIVRGPSAWPREASPHGSHPGLGGPSGCSAIASGVRARTKVSGKVRVAVSALFCVINTAEELLPFPAYKLSVWCRGTLTPSYGELGESVRVLRVVVTHRRVRCDFVATRISTTRSATTEELVRVRRINGFHFLPVKGRQTLVSLNN